MKFSKRYAFLTIALLATAFGLLFLPEKTNVDRMDPEHLLLKSLEKGHYISSDEVADMIIQQDPSILLVDVRDSAQYQAYALPTAINIPYQELSSDKHRDFFGNEAYKLILYSNDQFLSEQAWTYLTSLQNEYLYILEGGLNKFYETILTPTYPTEMATQLEFEQYNFRKAAGYYFGLPTPTTPEKKRPVPKVVKPKIVYIHVKDTTDTPTVKESYKKPEIKKKPIPITKKKKKKKKRRGEGGC